MHTSCTGRIEAQIKKTVGKNTLANFGKDIARLLGKEDWEGYSGHCWRRTSATFCAESGFSLPEIKNVTGHKSDTAVQGYIDSSTRMKRKAAGALSVPSSAENASSADESIVLSKRKNVTPSSGSLITINLINSSITSSTSNAPIFNFQGARFCTDGGESFDASSGFY